MLGQFPSGGVGVSVVPGARVFLSKHNQRMSAPTRSSTATVPTNRPLRIAAIPGDGIGKEVMPEGLRVLQAAKSRFEFEMDITPID